MAVKITDLPSLSAPADADEFAVVDNDVDTTKRLTLSLLRSGFVLPISLVAEVTGTLPVANGGTGQTSLAADRVLTGNDVGGVVAESGLTFDGTDLSSVGRVVAGTHLAGSVKTITLTGTQDDLDIDSASVLRCNNATDLTINGILAGTSGQFLVIDSVGNGQVYLAHENAGSTAANRLSNTVVTGVTPLAAFRGRAVYYYSADTGRWMMLHHDQGYYLTQPFDSGDYTAESGDWTVDGADVLNSLYMVRGRQLHMLITIESTDVSATPAYLAKAYPNGYQAPAADVYRTIIVNDAGGGAVVGAGVAKTTGLQFYSSVALGGWSTTSGDNTGIQGDFLVSIT